MEPIEKWTLTSLVFVVTFGILCGLGGCYCCEQTQQKAIEKGLVQKQVGNNTIWTKPDAKD